MKTRNQIIIYSLILLPLEILGFSNHVLKVDTVIKIDLSYQFEDDYYNVDWVFESMNPRVVINENLFYPKNNNLQDNSNLQRLLFEIPYDSIKLNKTDFIAFEYGNRRKEIYLRPIFFSSDKTDSSDRVTGSMSPIKLLKQASPNWLILKKGEWLTNEKGEVRLDITIFNPLPRTYPGVRVILRMTDSYMFCLSTPRYYKIPVKIIVNQDEIELFSEDPDIGEKIKRKVNVERGACGEISIDLNLGTTSSFESEVFTRIVYTFESKVKHKSNFLNFKELIYGVVFIDDSKFYPKEKYLGESWSSFFGIGN